MTRHALTVAAVLVWAVLMAVQVRRHVAPAGLDPSTLPAVAGERTAAGEEWFGVYQGERKIGWGRRRTRPTSDGGLRVRVDRPACRFRCSPSPATTSAPGSRTSFAGRSR